MSGNIHRQMGDTVPNTVTDLTKVRIDSAKPATLAATPRLGDWFTVMVRDDRGPTLFANAVFIER
jgi:hypothetical protein